MNNMHPIRGVLRRKGSARVEVLLRQQGFKAKADIDGKTLTGEKAKQTLSE